MVDSTLAYVFAIYAITMIIFKLPEGAQPLWKLVSGIVAIILIALVLLGVIPHHGV